MPTYIARGSSEDANEGECWFCTESCYDIDFCDGCDVHVCEDCNEVAEEDLPRRHNPEDHQPDDLEFDD